MEWKGPNREKRHDRQPPQRQPGQRDGSRNRREDRRGQSSPASATPIPRHGFGNVSVRDRVLRRLHDARESAPPPIVGISNRPGFGYDSSVFTTGNRLQRGRNEIVPTSLPSGFDPLPRDASRRDAERNARDVQDARAREVVAKARGERSPLDADGLPSHGLLGDVHGLFIPGGQDREEDGSPEKTTREAYEQALIQEARTRGLPTLAVCGGSRCLLRGFGGEEQTLSEDQQVRHNQRGTTTPAHSIQLPDPHTILGSAAPYVPSRQIRGAPPLPSERARQTGISRVNSTHTKIGRVNARGNLDPVNRLPNGESELVISARDAEGDHEEDVDRGTPEGFETRYGAPIVGVTSHPEAIYGTNSSRGAFERNPDAIDWSDNIFRGFAQSMRAYAARQRVNDEIRRVVPLAPAHVPAQEYREGKETEEKEKEV